MAQQTRDDAENDLKKADFDLQNAENLLDAALKKVAQIREKYTLALNEYSLAKW